MSGTAQETKHLTGQEGLAKIGELIKDIHIAMLITAAHNGTFDSRPMATQKTQTEFDGTFYFLTQHTSGKVKEIEHDTRVGLIYADPFSHDYITIKGTAEVSTDRAKIHELWNPMFKAWFPEGEEDPNIAILKVTVTEAEYWEASSSKLIFGIKYLAAAITGGAVDVGETGKVTV